MVPLFLPILPLAQRPLASCRPPFHPLPQPRHQRVLHRPPRPPPTSCLHALFPASFHVPAHASRPARTRWLAPPGPRPHRLPFFRLPSGVETPYGEHQLSGEHERQRRIFPQTDYGRHRVSGRANVVRAVSPYVVRLASPRELVLPPPPHAQPLAPSIAARLPRSPAPPSLSLLLPLDPRHPGRQKSQCASPYRASRL